MGYSVQGMRRRYASAFIGLETHSEYTISHKVRGRGYSNWFRYVYEPSVSLRELTP